MQFRFDNVYISSTYLNLTAGGYFPGVIDSRIVDIVGAEKNIVNLFGLLVYLGVVSGVAFCCVVFFKKTIQSQSNPEDLPDGGTADLESKESLIQAQEGQKGATHIIEPKLTIYDSKNAIELNSTEKHHD